MSNKSVWTERRTVRTSDGLSLVVREAGSPAHPPLLLVHGFPDTSAIWEPVVEALRASWHVIAYDVRGAGESEAPSGRSGYALSQLADDLFAVVDSIQRPAGSKVHVFAHDWGSIQSWEAVTDPRAAKVLATYTSMSGPCLDHVGHLMRGAPLKRPVSFLNQALKSYYVYFFHLPVLPELLGRTRIVRKIFGGRPTIARDWANGVDLYRANVLRSLIRPRKLQAQVPVQLIVLTKDAFVSPFMTSAAKPWVADLTWSEFPAAHWPQQKHAEQLASLVTDFALDHERATLGA